jgi:DNA-binding response OmpR family regulator
MVMPGNMTGRELAERFKALKPSLRVIYTSGYSVETVSKGLGFNRGLNYIPKPYHPNALLKAIRACLDG